VSGIEHQRRELLVKSRELLETVKRLKVENLKKRRP